MSVNIINMVRGYLNPSVIRNYATHLGESESSVSKTLTTLVPLIVGALADKQQAIDNLFGTVKDIYESGSLNGLGSAGNSDNPQINKIIDTIFGDKVSDVLSACTNFAGIRDSSTAALLDVSSAATLGVIGKHITENKMDAAALEGILSGQKEWIASALPANFSLKTLGLGSFFDTLEEGSPTTEKNPAFGEPKKAIAKEYSVPKEKENAGSIWKWLLPLILLLLAAWFFWKQYNSNKEKTTNKTEAATTNTAATTTESKELTTFKIDSIEIQGLKGGMEEQMFNYLKSGKLTSATDNNLKDTWYNFDSVQFVFGKTDQLKPGSEKQLQNIANILKAYPNAKIKVGAYTDKTGDAETNKKVSQARAEYIKAQLTQLGVGSQVVAAEGYGSKFAKVPATASDEERAADRKIAVRFVKL